MQTVTAVASAFLGGGVTAFFWLVAISKDGRD